MIIELKLVSFIKYTKQGQKDLLQKNIQSIFLFKLGMPFYFIIKIFNVILFIVTLKII